MKKNVLLALTTVSLTASALHVSACQNPSQWLNNSQRSTINSTNGLSHNTSTNPNQLRLTGGGRIALQRALRIATQTGMKLTISGSYTIDSPVTVPMRNDVEVDAMGAQFTGTSRLNGDLIRFSTDSTTPNCSQSDLLWEHGTFYMRDAPVSGVSPAREERLDGHALSTASTGDAISVRAHNDTTTTRSNITIRHIEFYGTKTRGRDYRYAGGDSGLLISGGAKGTFSNNEFYGVRDAAIYVTADNDNGTKGDNYRMTDNIIQHAFDGVTSKRGADNIVMSRNDIKDTVVAVSTKLGRTGLTWVATNVTADNNTIERTVRGISFEYTDNVKIRNNTFNSFGSTISNNDPNKGVRRPRNDQDTGSAIRQITPNNVDFKDNRYGNQYEAISLSGSQGTKEITGNTFNGTGTSSNNYAIAFRKHTGRDTTGIRGVTLSRDSNNTFSGVRSRTVNNVRRYEYRLPDFN